MDTRTKIIDLEGAASLAGRRLILAAGSFDVLRADHARWLGDLRAEGHLLLAVVYDDASLGRPLLGEQARAQLAAALAAVDYVILWPRDQLDALATRLQADRVERVPFDERQIIELVLEKNRS